MSNDKGARFCTSCKFPLSIEAVNEQREKEAEALREAENTEMQAMKDKFDSIEQRFAKMMDMRFRH